MKQQIILLDGQTIQALPIAKSLKSQGFQITLFCDSKSSYGYRTKFANKKILVPSIKDHVEEFHQFFLSYLNDNEVDVVIPMNDYSAHYLSLHKSFFANKFKALIPDYKIFMTGYDKNKLMKVCQVNNFPHPRTYDLAQNDIEDSTKYVGFPSLIKPNKTTGARGFAIVHSIEDIKVKLPAIKETYGECHLQEYIPAGGNQYKVELFIHDHNLINSTVIHKIRFYPKKGGSSCFNQTVLRIDLVELCFKVLQTIGWIGFADFDLIEDPRDNIVKIMEINPRVPACIKASFSAGVDFAENIVNASIGLSPSTYVYTPGSYLRYLGLDLLWFLNSKKRFHSDPSWFRALFSNKQFLQDGSWDDPLPFIYGTKGALLKQLNPQLRVAKKEMN